MRKLRTLIAAVVWTLEITPSRLQPAPPPVSTAFKGVVSVSVDQAGSVYFPANGCCIFKIDANGAAVRVAGTPLGYVGDGAPATGTEMHNPGAPSAGIHGNLYFVDAKPDRVRKMAPNGIISTVAPLEGAGRVAADLDGNLYVVQPNQNKVQKVAVDGSITTVAGDGTRGYAGDGGPATSASLYEPAGVAVDPAGNLYIADWGNHTIRKVARDGTISTIAGNGTGGYSGDGGPATGAQLYSPMGVAVDRAGNVFVADFTNWRVRKIGTDGVITTLAGNGTRGNGGDGGPATSAQLGGPNDVAVDAAGNVYIADSNNNVIRKVASNGTISTVGGVAAPVEFATDDEVTHWSVGAWLAGRIELEGDGLNVVVERCVLTPKRTRELIGIVAGVARPVENSFIVQPRSAVFPIARHLRAGETLKLPPFTLRIPLHGLALQASDSLSFEINLAQGGKPTGYVPARARVRLPGAFVDPLHTDIPVTKRATVTVGAGAPSIPLKDLDGADRTLDVFKGNLILLDFWTTWCGTCRDEMPVFERLHREFSSQGVSIVAVDVDESARVVKSVLEKEKFTFPVLLAQSADLSDTYPVNGYPTLVVIGRDGRVLEILGVASEAKLRSLIERGLRN